MNQVYKALGEEPRAVEDLRAASTMGEEEFDKALEKLGIHGGARVDYGGLVTRGGTGWKKTYAIQARYRAEQFEKVLRFTASTECRMAALVRHFGDLVDASRSCGKCDVCDPAGAELRQFRHATAAERVMAQQIVDELRPVDYKATGTLQRSLDSLGALSRNEYEALLDAMVRAGLIEMEDAEFEKDGEVIRFRKVRLTGEGMDLRLATPLALLLSDGVVEGMGAKSAGSVRKKSPAGKTTKKAGSVPATLSASDEALAARLREWRAAEAKRLRVPAYLVMHDRTLSALAQARPGNLRELLEIDGMGPAKVEKFGESILELCGKG